MNISIQKTIDDIYEKILKNYKKVKWKEIQQIIFALNTRLRENDDLTKTIGMKNILKNFDYLMRAFYESINSKILLNYTSKHYICSNIAKACNGFLSQDRRNQFFSIELFYTSYVRFNQNYSKANYLIFHKDNYLILLLEHKDGFQSILNRAEEVLNKILIDKLFDYGFDYNYPNIKILVRDVCEIYYSYKYINNELEFFEIDKLNYKNYWDYYINNTNKEIDSLTKNIKYDLEGIATFDENQEYDAFEFLTLLFEKANNNIFIIDPYVDKTLISLIKYSNNNVSIKLITSKFKSVKEELNRIIKQSKRINIRTNSNLHDRYIMIDNKYIYLLGSSLNGLGKKNSNIKPIKDFDEFEKIKDNLNELWNKSIILSN